MSLILAVPNITARSTDGIELQPHKVKKWLDELPLLNPVETGRKLFSTLSVHNRIDYGADVRLQLLELFRYSVSQISLELAKQYVGLPLPLSDKHKAVAEQNRQFQMEMANGYKRLALHSAPRERTTEALVIQRAIRYLTGVLVASYQTYSPYPQGTWKEIHALYAHAESLELTQVDVEDKLNKSVSQSSIGHAYKQALLLDFSDPYHLPPRLINAVQNYLDRTAPSAQLIAATRDYNPTCRFLIDQQQDHAGVVYSDRTTPEDLKRYRLLDTVELVRQAHAQLTQLNAGQTPPSDGLPGKFFAEFGADLLRRLVNAWGVNPQRSFRRSPATGRPVEIAVGMDRINYWINGGKKFIVSSTFVGPVPQRTMIASGESKPKETRIPGRELSTWNIHDESAGGLSLSKSGQIRLHIQVGDLLITRAPGESSPWRVGVIRWVRSPGASNMEIGIQHLAPGADPVVIKTVNEAGKESDFLPALLLPEIKPLKRPQTLIAHRGVFRPGHAIFMDNGCRLYRIAPTRLIESSHAFEQFSFDFLDT